MLEKNWNSPCSLIYFVGCETYFCVHFYIDHISLSWERSPCCVYHYGWIFHQPAALIWFVDVAHIPTQSQSPSSIQLTEEDVVQHVQSTFITSSPITLVDHSLWGHPLTSRPSLSHIFHDFSSPLLLMMSAQCGWLRMLKITHSSNVSHLVQWTIIFKVEKVHFHWRLVCGWLGMWQCVYAWAYVCLHVCSP